MKVFLLIAVLVCFICSVTGSPVDAKPRDLEFNNIFFRKNITRLLDNKAVFSPRATWDYTDPSTWSTTYPNCGGSSQSPIDIITNDAVDKGFNFLGFSRYLVPQKWGMTNSGHSIILYPIYDNFIQLILRIPFISNGEFPTNYDFQSLHFHWGTDSTKGSEHLFNSKQYPAEMHLVHYNKKYGNVANAVNYSDGLAVIGVMIEVGDQDNQNFIRIIEKLTSVASEGDEVELTGISLAQLMPVDKVLSRYFRYHGSLTTPECNEVVTWLVLEKKISLSESQLNSFRSIFGDNYRPVQALNGRTVSQYN